MSITVEMYKVKLEFFYQILGSKNEKLVEQTLQYIDEANTRFWEAYPKKTVLLNLYRNYLEQIIFEGVLDFPRSIEKFNQDVNDEHQLSIDDQGLLKSVIIALFAQDASFQSYGGYGWSEYTNLFEDLKSIIHLSDKITQLINFVLDGRPLATEIFREPCIGLSYYGYLSNAEVRMLSKSLSFYQTPAGLEHLRQLSLKDSGDTSVQDGLETLQEVFLERVS